MFLLAKDGIYIYKNFGKGSVLVEEGEKNRLSHKEIQIKYPELI